MEPHLIFIRPDDPPPPDGTPRRIEHIRKAVAEGDDPYERILTRYAAQLLLGEIDKPSATAKIYYLRLDNLLYDSFDILSGHRTIEGAVRRLREVAQERNLTIRQDDPENNRLRGVPADTPSAEDYERILAIVTLNIED